MNRCESLPAIMIFLKENIIIQCDFSIICDKAFVSHLTISSSLEIWIKNDNQFAIYFEYRH